MAPSFCVLSVLCFSSHIRLGPTLIPYDLILTRFHLQRSNFQMRSHTQVQGLTLPQSFWGGHDVTHHGSQTRGRGDQRWVQSPRPTGPTRSGPCRQHGRASQRPLLSLTRAASGQAGDGDRIKMATGCSHMELRTSRQAVCSVKKLIIKERNKIMRWPEGDTWLRKEFGVVWSHFVQLWGMGKPHLPVAVGTGVLHKCSPFSQPMRTSVCWYWNFVFETFVFKYVFYYLQN